MHTARGRFCRALALPAILFCLLPSSAAATEKTGPKKLPRQIPALFPHWNLADTAVSSRIAKFHAFVERHRDKGHVAVFDWDGTIYAEGLPVKEYPQAGPRSAQSAWHIWAAYHVQDTALRLFPLFRTNESAEDVLRNLLQRDDYLENRTNIQLDEYSKFTQIANFEAGMTPAEMASGIRGYLRDYPVSLLAYMPVLDLMQVLVDAGFKVWIVSGSNPFYLSVLAKTIEDSLVYVKDRRYRLNMGTVPYAHDGGRIAGNCAKLGTDGRFTMAYDDRFTRGSGDGKLYIVNGEGKRHALQTYIEKREGASVVLVAGNSGGDVPMMQYATSRPDADALCVAVNPNGALQDFCSKNPEKTIPFAVVAGESKRE